MRDSRFFEQPPQQSQPNQSHSNQRSHSHHSDRDARDTKDRGGNGKRKLVSPDSSDDDQASARSQSASGHEPQRSLQRNQRDHFSQGGKGRQPARNKGRYERAEAYFTEQGSVSDATDAQANHSSRWYSSDLPPRRPPHPPPVVLHPTAKQRRKPGRRCTTIVLRQKLTRRLRERVLEDRCTRKDRLSPRALPPLAPKILANFQTFPTTHLHSTTAQMQPLRTQYAPTAPGQTLTWMLPANTLDLHGCRM